MVGAKPDRLPVGLHRARALAGRGTGVAHAEVGFGVEGIEAQQALEHIDRGVRCAGRDQRQTEVGERRRIGRVDGERPAVVRGGVIEPALLLDRGAEVAVIGRLPGIGRDGHGDAGLGQRRPPGPERDQTPQVQRLGAPRAAARGEPLEQRLGGGQVAVKVEPDGAVELSWRYGHRPTDPTTRTQNGGTRNPGTARTR